MPFTIFAVARTTPPPAHMAAAVGWKGPAWCTAKHTEGFAGRYLAGCPVSSGAWDKCSQKTSARNWPGPPFQGWVDTAAKQSNPTAAWAAYQQPCRTHPLTRPQQQHTPATLAHSDQKTTHVRTCRCRQRATAAARDTVFKERQMAHCTSRPALDLQKPAAQQQQQQHHCGPPCSCPHPLAKHKQCPLRCQHSPTQPNHSAVAQPKFRNERNLQHPYQVASSW